MNQASTVLVSVLVASAAAAGIGFALRPAEKPPDTTIPDLQRAIEDLRTSNDTLRQRVETLAKTPAPAAAPAAVERTAAPAVSQEQIAAAVDAWMKKQAPGGGGGGAVAAAPTFDLDKELSLLRGVYFDENPELWKRLHASGKGLEAVKRFAALAEANPKDVKAQMDYANACLSYMRMDQGNYELAVDADKAFDKVLAIDDKHWEARFTKAISYSFWPEFTGKPKEAIVHFEKLLEQQETMPVQAQDAQTYLMLGNLLERSNPTRAKEVWAKGARRHPDNADLAGKAK